MYWQVVRFRREQSVMQEGDGNIANVEAVIVSPLEKIVPQLNITKHVLKMIRKL